VEVLREEVAVYQSHHSPAAGNTDQPLAFKIELVLGGRSLQPVLF